jgi:thiol-disulfide isomerase/thioredoxin
VSGERLAARDSPARIHPILTLLVVALGVFWAAGASARGERPVDAYLFWRSGCPYCEKARSYLGQLKQEIPDLRVEYLEVSSSGANRTIFIAVSQALEIERPVVPIVVVGSRAFVGYLDDSTTGAAVRQAVLACRQRECSDIIAMLLESLPSEHAAPASAQIDTPPGGPVQAPGIPSSIDLPLLGEISTSALSLPLLTVVLGAVDGFNPCAMWVLVFLIGLLVGLKDHRRMWVLGGVFLLASAAVYFVFMAAWLNVLLFLGALLWIRLAVGVLALGGGAFYLREFVLSSEAVCKVTPPGKRQRIMEGLRRAVRQRRLFLALSGIVVLAIAVNLIELICSAGIPAVYTQVLSLTSLPPWQYYLYLLLYILVFLLDDLVVFATAMVTLQAAGLTAKYSRYSHLLGGVVLCGVGVLLLLRPEWLTFG